MTASAHDLAAIAGAFDIPGEFLSAVPTGSGHINDSYRATFQHAGQSASYLVQRINDRIFTDPVALMQNVQRVTSHLVTKFAGEVDRDRRSLTVIPTRDSGACYRDALGNYWRAYVFIDRAHSYDIVTSPVQAFEAAKAFGEFQQLLADLPAPRLHDTIPDFHHTPKRFAQLELALAADNANRAAMARAEIDFAIARKDFTSVLLDAKLPQRVTHNDTKLNNVLLDDRTGEGLCVIDLDTVMPGLAPFDFGDMVRTATSAASEDERDLSKVAMQFPMFEAVARGYLASAGGYLTAAERDHLVTAARLIAFEQGIRFLADYLAGDTYYKTQRTGQNLDRCRTQFKLVASIEEQEGAMRRLVASI